jgi:LysR family hydrogen peroxide-inducible transcriptional activator
LAELGHFGKAAEACHVSQPTLSIALKKLEESLGVTLIERSKQRILPTAVGEQVIQQAKVVLGQAALIQDIAASGKNALASPLKIGAIYTVGPYLFPHLLPEIKKLAPDMPLILEESYTGNLRKRLNSTELDAIIIALPFNEADVVCQTLYEEPFVVLLPKDHALAKHSAIKAEQLLDETVLLLGEGHCFRDQILESIPGLRESFLNNDYAQAAANNTSLETLKHMVLGGLGITILPLSATNSIDKDRALVTRPFKDVQPTRSVGLAWRASFPRFDAIDVISKAVKQCHIQA